MDSFLKDKLFDYEAVSKYNYISIIKNSNRVSFADKKNITNEPSGEGTTLKGNIVGRMGDRVITKKQIIKKEKPKDVKKVGKSNNDILDFENKTTLFYKPKTKESTEIYSNMLQIVNYLIPDQSSTELMKTLDEILAIIMIKNNSISEKYAVLESNLLSEYFNKEIFDRLVNLSKNLQDYSTDGNQSNTNDRNIALELNEDSEDSKIDEIESDKESESDKNYDSSSGEYSEKQVSDNEVQDLIENEQLDINRDDIEEDKKELNKKSNKEKNFLKLLIQRKGNYIDENQHKSNYDFKKRKDIKIVENTTYDIITIPPTVNENNSNIKELTIEKSLPSWMLPAFQHLNEEGELIFIMNKFNKVQSTVLNNMINTDESILVSAPTSSGKTIIALLSILRLISNYKKDNNYDLNKIKAIIITPMKALAKETVGNFTERLKSFNLKVAELSGDASLTKNEIEESNIIVSTPEKWDVVSRKVAMKSIIDSIKLIIIDEVHLLHDTRGSVIESIVSRVNREKVNNGSKVRIIALSATMPNYHDIAQFLQVDPENTFCFDNSFRPIPLEYNFISLKEKSIIKKNLIQNKITYDIVKERIGSKQVLIFVHSRRETSKTGFLIKDFCEKDETVNLKNGLMQENKLNELLEILKVEDGNISSNELKQLLPFGIGIHHAGLTRDDKGLVEELFNNGYLQVIISTATLAWGVNLPAHTVLIKGTQVYSPEKGCWTELSIQDILQMMGRAGRVGYSNIGEGFIITGCDEINYYLSIFNQQLPIESQLIKALPESINAEIALKSVNSLDDCIDWLKYTYLFIRMQKNPSLYGISSDEVNSDSDLYEVRKSLSQKTISMLESNGLITYNKKTGGIVSTQLGITASYFYLKYESISVYNQNLNSSIGIIDLFKIFSLSEEFKLISIREEEKTEIESLYYKVPIPIKGSIDENNTKINILLQAYISRIPLEGYSIMSDMIYISQNAQRIFRALFEISLRRNWSNVSQLCLSISKMIDKRMWNSMNPLRQFSISDDIVICFEKKEKLTWDRLLTMNPHEISELLNIENKEKAGLAIFKILEKYPKLSIQPHIQTLTSNIIQIELLIEANFNWDDKIHSKVENFHLIVEDNDSENILHSEIVSLSKFNSEIIVKFILPILNPLPPQHFLKLISDKWINCESCFPLSLRELILPQKFAEKIVLEENVLLPIAEIFKNDSNLTQLFNEDYNITVLNQIQTQIFIKLYHNLNESVLISAGSGAGKGTITKIINLISLSVKKKNKSTIPIVYVSPIEQSLLHEYNDYKKIEKVGFKVGLFTGKAFIDNGLFNTCDIIFSSHINFDAFIRKSINLARSITSVVLDHINEISNIDSSYEMLITRMRYSYNNNIKIIAMGDSISNYTDVIEWLNISKKQSFCFNSSIKTNKININITGFDNFNKELRLNVINQFIFSTLEEKNSSKSKINDQVLIISSNKEECKKLPLKIISYFSEKSSKIMKNDIKSKLNDVYLSNIVNYGIGYYHVAMNTSDKLEVISLYKSHKIKILIVSLDSIYEFNYKAKVIVIQDTMKYNPIQNLWEDYSIHDIYTILSKCSYYLPNISSEVFLLCQNSKKEFYKKFILDSFPIESSLHMNLTNYLNSEIARGIIKNKQTCIDWFTWTYLYVRLIQNPNYYDLHSTSDVSLNEYLSEIIDNSVAELTNANCIAGEDDLIATNYGKIANQYSLSFETIDLITKELESNKGKFKDFASIISILSLSAEIRKINFIENEEKVLNKLNQLVKYKMDESKVSLTEPFVKGNIILQLYLNRTVVPNEINHEFKNIIPTYFNLCNALVDITSSNALLEETLIATTLCQMIVQGQIINKSNLLQLPYFDDERVKLAKDNGIQDIASFLESEDDVRNLILKGFVNSQIKNVADICNLFPIYEVSYSLCVESKDNDSSNIFNIEDSITLSFNITRDIEFAESQITILSDKYPLKKEELWWAIIADRKSNRILSIKKFNFVKEKTMSMKSHFKFFFRLV